MAGDTWRAYITGMNEPDAEVGRLLDRIRIAAHHLTTLLRAATLHGRPVSVDLVERTDAIGQGEYTEIVVSVNPPDEDEDDADGYG
jgi:hypothetical protein